MLINQRIRTMRRKEKITTCKILIMIFKHKMNTKNINNNISNLIYNIKYLKYFFQPQNFRFMLILASGLLIVPLQATSSQELFLKCVGKYEIDRGALIKPDWETSYLTINMNGLISTIYTNGIKKVGRTSIRQNTYTITQRDSRNRVVNIYKINKKYNIYAVESPKINRTLIGNCQKGRG